MASLLGAENAVPQRMALASCSAPITLLLLSFVDNDTADDQTAARTSRLVMVGHANRRHVLRGMGCPIGRHGQGDDVVVRRVGETLRRYPNGAQACRRCQPLPVALSDARLRLLSDESCAELLSQVLLQRRESPCWSRGSRAIIAELALTSADEKDAPIAWRWQRARTRVVPVLVSGSSCLAARGRR